MNRTPSPPRRIHTPPAPLHGPMDDSYEPYSVRRTTRSAARELQSQTSPTRARQSRAGRASTPTNTKRKNAARRSNHGLSPPSSPASPYKLRTSPRSTRRAHFEVGSIDSDSDHQVAPTPSKRLLSAMDPRGSLPTPAKTPRKRALQTQEDLSSTSRVLFPSRPATIEDAMPTPRKYKGKKNALSLESFALAEDENDEQIPIYTDSKERIPEVDEAEDNPFITKKGSRKGKAKAKAQVNRAPKSREPDERTAEMYAAVGRGEGMIFNFRGKKILRKFTDRNGDNASDAQNSDEDLVRRHAGREATRALDRSEIQPRILFRDELGDLDEVDELDELEDAEEIVEENVEEDAEEAVTDIEEPIPSGTKIVLFTQEATPPPTTRSKRPISFEGWSRVKSGSAGASSSSKKRGGSPMEASSPKHARTR